MMDPPSAFWRWLHSVTIWRRLDTRALYPVQDQAGDRHRSFIFDCADSGSGRLYNKHHNEEDDNDDWWSTSVWRWRLSTDAGSWLDMDEDRSKLIRYVILYYNWSGENETTIQGKRFIKKGKQDRRWIWSSKKKRWDRAKRLLRATKTLRAYVECTRDVITKKSPCCSKQSQSLIRLLFHLVLTHRIRPNPWYRGTDVDHSVAVISNQSRPSKI